MTISAMSLANSRKTRAGDSRSWRSQFTLDGSTGYRKTMLASRLPGLLPPLSNQEALESAAILSLVNAHYVTRQWRRRPFRAPHHSASLTAMVGGGSIPAPGRSPWRITVFCFLMNYLNSSVGFWMHYESPLNQENSSFPHSG